MAGTLKKIMLLDAYSTRTLACVRSFGKHGIPFAVGGESRWDMSLYSRYCSEPFLYTSPYISISKYISDINSNIRRLGIDLVLPTSEAGILACDRHRAEICAEVVAPTTQQIDLLFHKSKTLALAQSAGVPVPRTEVLGPEDLASSGEGFPFPVPAIIKADSSDTVQEERVVRGGGTVYVLSGQELLEKAKEKLLKCQQILVQEFINGYGVGISGVFRQGEPVALFGHRRVRESNPLGGPSAVAVSIPISREMFTATANIMRRTGYTGAAMVEYKVDRVTGTPYFMEINGRLWGSILLPLAAGLDLPYLLWKVLTGEQVAPEETGYREGVVGRNLFGDTKHLLSVLKGRPKGWPGDFPGRLEALVAYSAAFFGGDSKNLLMTSDDPKPAFGRLLQELFA